MQYAICIFTCHRIYRNIPNTEDHIHLFAYIWLFPSICNMHGHSLTFFWNVMAFVANCCRTKGEWQCVNETMQLHADIAEWKWNEVFSEMMCALSLRLCWCVCLVYSCTNGATRRGPRTCNKIGPNVMIPVPMINSHDPMHCNAWTEHNYHNTIQLYVYKAECGFANIAPHSSF